MEDVRREGKKGLMIKTWERCKSFGRFGMESSTSSSSIFAKSKSWSDRMTMKKSSAAAAAAPEGYLWVYVGEERRRFVIKTEYINHPLFKELLEEAESEYGYRSEGPLLLPCEVNRFLCEIMEFNFQHDNCNSNNINNNNKKK